MVKPKILIVGAGKIGVTVAVLLANSLDYEVYIGDITVTEQLPDISKNPIKFIQTDINKPEEVQKFIKENAITGIISCLPFHLTIRVANIAAATNINYFDPTEDIATTAMVLDIQSKCSAAFAPQCGLAPGFISIAANSLVQGFDVVDSLKMRVGALTQSTNNSLHYGFTWSIDGLINEYICPCEIIEDGKRKFVPALAGLEELVIDKERYEAFNTSGGVGSLVATYAGKIRNLDYKTIRYPGHCERMTFLLNDLRLREDPKLVKEILTRVIPYTTEDKVVVYVAVQGHKNGVLQEKTYTKTLQPKVINGQTYTAIQMTTASGICTVVDMVIKEKCLGGFVRQEDIRLADFLANRFGSYYA